MKRSLIVLALAAACAGGAAAATDVQGPQGLLKGQVPDDLPALKRVAISTFVVQYVTEIGIGTKRQRGDVFFSKWKEPAPEVFQAAADGLYAQLVTDLKASGIDVVPLEEVSAQPVIGDLRKLGRPSPAVISDATLMKASTMVSAHNLPLVLIPVQDARLDSYATQPLPNTDGPRNLTNWDRQAKEWHLGLGAETFSVAGIYTGQNKLSETLKATVLNVRLTIPLVDLGVTTCGNTQGSCSGWGNTTALIKPNARLVEAGTVFNLAHGGNPGHRHVLGLQKPVPITGLKVSTDIDRLEVYTSTFGKDVKTARSGGLVGLLARGAGADSDKADFWVSFDAAELQPALVSAASPVFKELAAILTNPK